MTDAVDTKGRAARGAGPEGPLLLGIRHHGPGSARAVRAALDAYAPRVVLIEGPPEGDAVVPLAASPDMVPPVALLAHAVNEPGKAAFWPLAHFSPEWVALRWAAEHGVPVRFIDLPAAHALALGDGDPPAEADGEAGEGGARDGGPGAAAPGGGRGAPPAAEELRLDPLAMLAEAAGYDDPERWWEDVVEHRGTSARAPAPAPDGPAPARSAPAHPGTPAGATSRVTELTEPRRASEAPDPYEPFAALAEAMAELRAVHGDGGHRRDLVREAHMRLRLREACKEFGDGHTAVVCGAWHVPALAARSTVTADRRLLKGLPKVKAEVTWVPWTHRRLARASGYGAGIASPGWYGHLFSAPDRPVERWMTRIAELLREQDMVVSSAHVIEAVRLAGTLASLRGRPLAGLGETLDAARAVLCEGSGVPMDLVADRLVVGDVLGRVPEGAPAVPLQRDLERCRRAVRLTFSAEVRELDLDLRKETDAARSRLLHRLRLLGVDWGEPARSRSAGTGTFRESWRLCWEPELSVRVAEAGIWGTTVYDAATAKARSAAEEAATADGAALARVTALAETCLPAALPEAVPVVMRVLADRAALESDVGHLAQALPALVRTVRYGDVRGTDPAVPARVAAGLAERVCVGLPPACAVLDAEGARDMRTHLDVAHQAVTLLARESPEGGEGAGSWSGAVSGADPGSRSGTDPDPDPDPVPDPESESVPVPGGAALLGRWRSMLRSLAARDGMPGLIRGRCARLLLDDGALADEEAARLMGLALSPGTPPAEAAAWVEGFLSGGGMLLVHDERLLTLVDRWLTAVPAEAFTDVLPLLRRTFAEYEAGVRRTLGELIRRGPLGTAGDGPASGGALPGFGPGLDEERAGAAADAVLRLLGAAADEAVSPAAAAVAPAAPGESATAAESAALGESGSPLGSAVLSGTAASGAWGADEPTATAASAVATANAVTKGGA
ncbi:DUF5682 family protein [Streptomyces cacaoi]|uniref:DUF5682 family protein n=1 Tax=Streptomyces cacaoi TaxID=1898 RepID=UPI001CAA381E|nr:DUF5682 family protein [Streptomyces cacaoi]